MTDHLATVAVRPSKVVLDAELLDRIHAVVAENDRLKEENERLRAEVFFLHGKCSEPDYNGPLSDW